MSIQGVTGIAGILPAGSLIDPQALNFFKEIVSPALEENPADGLFAFPLAIMDGD